MLQVSHTIKFVDLIVPTQWKENEENLGQHSFNHIMDDPSEKPFSSKRKSNWIVRFFTYCFKKLFFKTHC